MAPSIFPVIHIYCSFCTSSSQTHFRDDRNLCRLFSALPSIRTKRKPEKLFPRSKEGPGDKHVGKVVPLTAMCLGVLIKPQSQQGDWVSGMSQARSYLVQSPHLPSMILELLRKSRSGTRSQDANGRVSNPSGVADPSTSHTVSDLVTNTS